MQAYPPEYDELHAVALAVPTKPEWVTEFWHDEYGNITAQLAKTGTMRAVGKAEEEADAIAACVAWLERYAALAARVDAARTRIDQKTVPAGWWADLWQPIFDLFGTEPKDGDMFTDDSEAGDTWAQWDDDSETYQPRAYTYDFGRDEGGDFVKVGTWDGDDWEYEYVYEEEAEYLFRHMDTDPYFVDWADYYLYQFRTGIDPLENWYKVPTDEEILKSAEDNLRYAEG